MNCALIYSLAIQAMQQLHPDIIASVQAKTLFSKDEEAVLSTVASVCIHYSVSAFLIV